jgi:hypothetical protein
MFRKTNSPRGESHNASATLVPIGCLFFEIGAARTGSSHSRVAKTAGVAMMRSRWPCCRRRSSSQAQCPASLHKRALPVGPPIEHKVARETFLKDAAAAGLAVASEHVSTLPVLRGADATTTLVATLEQSHDSAERRVRGAIIVGLAEPIGVTVPNVGAGRGAIREDAATRVAVYERRRRRPYRAARAACSGRKQDPGRADRSVHTHETAARGPTRPAHDVRTVLA